MADASMTPWAVPIIAGLASSLPSLLGYAGPRTVLVGVAGALLAGLLTLTLRRADRRTVWLLYLVSFALRSAALMLLTSSLTASGEPYLSPDGKSYWARALAMANGTLDFHSGAVSTLGTYDVAAYYYFGWLTRAVGRDLFSLQFANVVVSSLVAPLAYAWLRRFVPSLALVVAAVLALHPSLIYMSACNLLKDPSVVLASVAVVWAVTGMLGTGPRPIWLMYLVGGLPAAAYLRFGRFYTLLYLAVGFAVAVATAALVACRRPPEPGDGTSVGRTGSARPLPARLQKVATSCLAVLAIFGTTDLMAIGAGWPWAPIQALRQAQWSVHSPAMSRYAAGLVDVDRWSGPVRWAANGVRRLFGPFVWILPTSWDPRSLVDADYFLYPGMIVWYACLPFVLAGLARVACGVWRGSERRIPMVALLVFCAVYFAQFMTINLSYRQRDDTLPFLLVFAALGFAGARKWPRWRVAYAAYWGALVLMAVIHLAIRARRGI